MQNEPESRKLPDWPIFLHLKYYCGFCVCVCVWVSHITQRPGAVVCTILESFTRDCWNKSPTKMCAHSSFSWALLEYPAPYHVRTSTQWGGEYFPNTPHCAMGVLV